MKKRVVLGTAILVIALLSSIVFKAVNNQKAKSFFRMNLEALTESEINFYGHCYESENSCLYQCPSCGRVYEAPGHRGPSYGMLGVCECGATANAE